MLANAVSLSKFYYKSYQGLSLQSWRGVVLSFFESTLIGVFYFLTMYFVNDLNMSVAAASAIIACYGIGAIVGGYLGGIYADKYTPDTVSILALLLQAICFFGLTTLSTSYYLAANIFLLGIASYSFITANHLYVLSACAGNESERIKALNLLSTASNLGGAISGAALGFLLYYGFHNVFFVTAILLVILVLGFLFTRHDVQGHVVAAEKVVKEPASQETFNFIALAAVLVTVLFVGAVVAQLNSSYGIYIQARFPSLGVKAVSLLFTLNSLLVVAFATPLGELCHHYSKMRMVGIGGFFIGAGMCLLSVSHTFPIAMLACLVFTFGEMIFFSMAQYVCYHAGSSEQRGRSLGIFRAVYASSRVFGPIAGGLLYQHVSGEALWYACGVIGVMALLGCFGAAKFSQ